MSRSPRVVALCVFRDRDRILAFHVSDSDEGGWRPLGGSVEWGETAEETIVREIREELGVELREPHLLTTMENIFRYQGELGHEIVFVFDGRLPDRALYEVDSLPYTEADLTSHDGSFEGRAYWKSLGEFEAAGGPPLYPDGLLDFLKEQP